MKNIKPQIKKNVTEKYPHGCTFLKNGTYRLNRRDFLKLGGTVASSVVLMGCAASVLPSDKDTPTSTINPTQTPSLDQSSTPTNEAIQNGVDRAGICLNGEVHTSNIESLVFTLDGMYLLSGTRDESIKIWSLPEGNLLKTLDGILPMAISTDGEFLVSGSLENAVKIWMLSTGELVNSLKYHTEGICSLAIHPEGELIISGGYDDTIKIWLLETGRCIRSLDGGYIRWPKLAISQDGRYLASGGAIRLIELRSFPDCGLIDILEGHMSWVTEEMFTPTSDTLISFSDDRSIKLWSIPDGILIKTIFGCTAYALSPDGILLVTGSQYNNAINFWSVANGTLLLTLKGNDAEVVKLAICPDGRLLASSDRNNNIKLWSLPDGGLIKTLMGHTDIVLSLAFSPDGTLLASGGQDRMIKIWSIPEGNLVGCPHL